MQMINSTTSEQRKEEKLFPLKHHWWDSTREENQWKCFSFLSRHTEKLRTNMNVRKEIPEKTRKCIFISFNAATFELMSEVLLGEGEEKLQSSSPPRRVTAGSLTTTPHHRHNFFHSRSLSSHVCVCYSKIVFSNFIHKMWGMEKKGEWWKRVRVLRARKLH